jgi:GNAT superfamily N-acetyltransferase
VAPPDIRAADAGGAEACLLMDEMSAVLAGITGASGRASFDVADMRSPRALFVLARDAGGGLLGCAALRPLDGDAAELKRMYARPGGHGVGAALLSHMEQQARALGYLALHLETRRVNSRAVSFYQRHGYQAIPNYGKYIGVEHAVCLGKTLYVAGAETPATSKKTNGREPGSGPRLTPLV